MRELLDALPVLRQALALVMIDPCQENVSGRVVGIDFDDFEQSVLCFPELAGLVEGEGVSEHETGLFLLLDGVALQAIVDFVEPNAVLSAAHPDFIQRPKAVTVPVSEAVHGGWWEGYLTYGGDGYDYTFKPLTQMAANPYSFEAVLSNDGIAPQNTMLHVEVSESGANVFSSSSNSVLLNMSSPVDTFVANNTFSPSSLGVYEMALWGTGDSVNSDTAILMSVVTDYLYGRDFNNPTGSWRVGRSCGGMVLGLKYDMYANEDLYALQAHVDDESVVGSNMFAVLYESDPAGGDPIYLAQSDDYTITAADLGNWVTIPFDGAQQLFDGAAYIAAIGGYANPIDTFGISVSGVSQGSCYIQDNGCDIGSQGFGYWYTTSSTPMIRMDFNPLSLSSNHIFSEGLDIYPNPNDGIFVVNSNLILDQSVISIRNILGQEVYVSTHDIVNSEIIDVSYLEKGLYILEIINNDITISRKIIID